MRGWWTGLAAVVVVGAWSPARASGDFGCSTRWTTTHGDYSGCDEMPVLSPGNDTRVNLMLLLIDRHGIAGDPVRKVDPTAPPISDYPGFYRAFYPRRDEPDDEGYAGGEGSRCRSNASGARAFEAALTSARGLPADERALLAAARRGLQPDCSGAPGDVYTPGTPAKGVAAVADATLRVRSRPGTAYARYLSGAAAFYDGRYDAAAAAFDALRATGQPWLDDTAAYMAARVEVNRLQLGLFDQYGSFDGSAGVNGAVAAAAGAKLRGYLRDRPSGAYAASARGLLRRVSWLAGPTDRLAADYAALMALPASRRDIDDPALAQEIDNKLLAEIKPDTNADPALLAVADLQRMRTAGADAPDVDPAEAVPTLTRAALEAQRPRFAAAPALFDYLRAVHAFHVEHRPVDVLRLIPAGGARADLVGFSRGYLRAAALDATRDRGAEDAWSALVAAAPLPTQRGAAELGLAMHWERTGALPSVFAAGSPIRVPAIREILLTHVADPALLRRQSTEAAVPAHEREVALFTLLYKQLTRGRYAGFLVDVARVPAGAATADDGYVPDPRDAARPALGLFTQAHGLGDHNCPALAATATRLAADPRAYAARLCLADFVRVNGLDGFVLDTPPAADQLGGTADLFPGDRYARGRVYQSIMADPRAPADEIAYALFRAIRCYAPGGVTQCGEAEVPKAQRRAWFNRLKKDHPRSRWARELDYWW